MSDDITFCANTCKKKECFRNPVNIKDKTRPHSYAYCKGTGDCPFYNLCSEAIKNEGTIIAGRFKTYILCSDCDKRKDEFIKWSDEE